MRAKLFEISKHMKLPLLILLLHICSCATLKSSKGEDKDLLGETTLGEKPNNVTEGSSKNKTMDIATIVKIWQRFRRLKAKILKQLTLTPEQQETFAAKLKEWKIPEEEQAKASGDSIDEINKKNGIGKMLFQGDVVLTKAQADRIADDIENDGSDRGKRQAFRDKNYPWTIWSQGVYYYFDPSANEKARSVFTKAVQAWSKDTCIDFYYSAVAPDRIRLLKGDGCWSQMGKLGGEQDLSLGKDCETVGIAAHELGHALGLFHMQSRYDRDNFITVNVQNIYPDWVVQYAKETRFTNDNYGITYDYGGIMQYDALSSSSNGQPTMLPYDMRYIETLGSEIISFYELLMINQHYGCLAKCYGKPNLCANGGFPNPRDCSKCVCPSGYGGNLCDQKPPGCGSTLQASGTPQTLTDTVGDRDVIQREDFTFCHYWIEAPPGSVVEVKIKSFTPGVFSYGCKFAGVEIKTQKDQRLTGFRFCAHTDAGRTLVSESNRVPIITYNRYGESTTVLEYRTLNDFISAPAPVSTRQPYYTTTTTTTAPMPTSCMDKPTCPAQRMPNYCENRAFSLYAKKAICAKTCGFC